MNRTWAAAWPIKAGKATMWKQFSVDLGGARKAELEAFMKKCGIERTRTWWQKSPQGDYGVWMWEGQSPEKFWMEMKNYSQNDKFGQWFAHQIKDIHGWDMNSWDAKSWGWEIGADVRK